MMLDVTTVDNNIFGQIDLIEFTFEYDSDKDKPNIVKLLS